MRRRTQRIVILVLFAGLTSVQTVYAENQNIGLNKPCTVIGSTAKLGAQKLVCKSSLGELFWKIGDWETVEIEVEINLSFPKIKSNGYNLWEIEQECKAKLKKVHSIKNEPMIEVEREKLQLNSVSNLNFAGFKTKTSVGLLSGAKNNMGNSCIWKNKINLVDFTKGSKVRFVLGKVSKSGTYSQLRSAGWKLRIS